MKLDYARTATLRLLRYLAETALSSSAGLCGVTVEETDTSLIVRIPSLGAYWKLELSMVSHSADSYERRERSLVDFLSKEVPHEH